MSIHLIHITHPSGGDRYAFTWVVANVIFLRTGFRFPARAIAAANDLCSQLGTVPNFVR